MSFFSIYLSKETLQSWYLNNWISIRKIINLYPYFIQYTEIKSNLITGLIEENIGYYLQDFQVLKYFLDKTHNV